MSIGHRLRQALETIYGPGQGYIKEFSTDTGIKYRTIQEYLADSRSPGAEQLAKIYTHSRINIAWLLTGEGSMFRDDSKQPTSIQDIPKEKIKGWLDEFWKTANDKEKTWLEIQIEKTFPEYREWLQKNEGGNPARKAG